MNFKNELEQKVGEAEQIIQRYLPKETGYQKTVIQAMNYSMLAGGKRLRPILMQECFRLFGGTGESVCPFMAAIEMIHTYSLVHDDLPAMDNDEYRRGKKTTHIVYGEAMAILAGDALLNLAFETAASSMEKLTASEELVRTARALSILGKKAGIYGMIGGQTADIEAEETGAEAEEALLLFIHEHKTSALIEAAMGIGSVLAGADEKDADSVMEAARHIGLAFQIQDDILDVTSSLEQLGKQTGSDEKNHKVTYVTLKGLEESKVQVAKHSERALELFSSLPGENRFLEELIRDLITRDK